MPSFTQAFEQYLILFWLLIYKEMDNIWGMF